MVIAAAARRTAHAAAEERREEERSSAGGMGGGRSRRVLLHASGFRQSPYTDVGTAGGLHYLVWPLAEGTTLETMVQQQGRLSPHQTALVVHHQNPHAPSIPPVAPADGPALSGSPQQP